jgi:hypothetical protein
MPPDTPKVKSARTNRAHSANLRPRLGSKRSQCLIDGLTAEEEDEFYTVLERA